MHKEFWISLIAILVIFTGTLVFINQSISHKSRTQVSIDSNKTDQLKTITISSLNNSYQEGRAVLSNQNGKAQVLVKINSWFDLMQPLYIHEGTCQSLGPVKYPLTPLSRDVSITVLDVSLEELMNQEPLAISLHKSESEIDIYFACGEL
jgi:hypothetical protein